MIRQTPDSSLKPAFNPHSSLPDLGTGFRALRVLANHASIMMWSASEIHVAVKNPDKRPRDSLFKYMIWLQAKFLPLTTRSDLGDGALSFYGETDTKGPDDYDAPSLIVFLKDMYRECPPVVSALDTAAIVIAHEAEWKNLVRRERSPRAVEHMWDIYASLYRHEPPLHRSYTGSYRFYVPPRREP